MDKDAEIAAALIDLGRSAESVARLISSGMLAELTHKRVGSKSLDIPDSWPDVLPEPPPLDIPQVNSIRILEYSHTGRSVSAIHGSQVSLVANNYSDQPGNVRIVLLSEATAGYDVGIINESLEFSQDPFTILQVFKKQCKRIFVRFRPFSSHDGAFIGRKAFAHLAGDACHSVLFKVVKPLATYENLLHNKLAFTIINRHINIIQIPEMIQSSEVLDVIRDRTWGEIDEQQMLKILAIASVDYVLESN